MILGEKVRMLRQIKGYSQEKMASMLEMSAVTYGNFERNKGDISMTKLDQIAKIFGITVQDILTFGDKVSNFFEHCDSNNFMVGSGNTQMIGSEEKEWKMAMENLRLEIKALEAERDKFKAEALLWQERYTIKESNRTQYAIDLPSAPILNENPEDKSTS